MNNVQDLYNWAPVARVMLMGIIVALGPLAWIWMRNRKACLLYTSPSPRDS